MIDYKRFKNVGYLVVLKIRFAKRRIDKNVRRKSLVKMTKLLVHLAQNIQRVSVYQNALNVVAPHPVVARQFRLSVFDKLRQNVSLKLCISQTNNYK